MLNGVISHYDVEFGEQGSPSQLIKTSDMQLLLTELNPSAVYAVRVRANNYARLDRSDSDVLSGAFSNVTTIRLPDPPPGMYFELLNRWFLLVEALVLL